MLALSQRNRDRLHLLRQVHERVLTVAEGARRAGISQRQMRRQLRRFEVEGDVVVVHRLRGRPSNRRLPDSLRERALLKAAEAMYQDFGPTLLSEHLARDGEIGLVHPSTLRNWLIEAGRLEPKRRKLRHRRRRERRAACGELVLMDTSIHDWLEGRSGEEMVLIAMIDDATSRLYARFFRRDTGAANRQLIADYLEAYGRMGALYVDRAGHFRVNFRRKEREEKDLSEARTLIGRGLAALDIELILALSPQAKGRVERAFGTLQDRLIKEMRVAGISSLREANTFLEEVFIPFWNERFTEPPREEVDAHRSLPEGVDLLRIFAETKERVIRPDFTFRNNNIFFQIEEEEADSKMPGGKVVIEMRLDGTTRYRWKERYLEVSRLAGPPQKKKEVAAEETPAAPKERRLSGAAGRPIPADHPWRRFPVLVGKAKYQRPPVVASAALRPDSPAVEEPVAISP